MKRDGVAKIIDPGAWTPAAVEQVEYCKRWNRLDNPNMIGAGIYSRQQDALALADRIIAFLREGDPA